MKNITINYDEEKTEVTIKTDDKKAKVKVYRFDKEGECLDIPDYRVLYALADYLDVLYDDYVEKGYIFSEGYEDILDPREEED